MVKVTVGSLLFWWPDFHLRPRTAPLSPSPQEHFWPPLPEEDDGRSERETGDGREEHDTNPERTENPDFSGGNRNGSLDHMTTAVSAKKRKRLLDSSIFKPAQRPTDPNGSAGCNNLQILVLVQLPEFSARQLKFMHLLDLWGHSSSSSSSSSTKLWDPVWYCCRTNVMQSRTHEPGHASPWKRLLMLKGKKKS